MDLKSQLDLDNYSIWFEPFWDSSLFKIFIALLLVLFCIVVCCFVYKIYKLRKKNFWKISLDELEKIESFNENDRLRYFKLTQVLKSYFTQRFKTNFNNKTDDEFILKAREIPLLNIFNKDIENIFTNSKLAKFSNCGSVNFDCDLKLSKQIIESTIPTKANNKI